MRKTFTLKLCSYLIAALLCSFSVQAQQCPGIKASLTSNPLINLCSGSSVTLGVKTDPLFTFYQWQRQTTAGGPFTNISGGNSSSYTTSSIGAFRVIVGNATCRDTSSIVNVINLVLQGGTITGGPSSPICPNAAGGELKGKPVPGDETGNLTYQWEMKTLTGDWTIVESATALNYNTGYIPNTTSFRRSVKDNCGNIAYSNIITITTSTPIQPGSIAPASQTISAGSVASTLVSSMAATGGQGTISYQWQSSPVLNGGFTDIAGATGANYSPGVLTSTTYFRRMSRDAGCNNSVPSQIIEVIVINPLELKVGMIASRYSCVFPGKVPAPITTQVPATGGILPYTMEWEISTDNINWTKIAGASGNTYQPGILNQTSYFRKKITDAAGTVGYTNSVTITLKTGDLNPGAIQATSNVACLGSSPALIKGIVSASNFGEVVDYKWQSRIENGNWEDIEGPSTGDLLPDPITQKTYFRRATIDGCGVERRTAYSNEVVIDTRPALLAGDITPSSQMIFINGTPKPITSSEAPSGGTGSNVVWWEKANLAVGPWSTITGASALNYQSPSLDNTAYFRRVVKDNGCLATKYTYVVEVFVNTAPAIVPGALKGSKCVFPGQVPGRIQFGDTITGGMPPYTFSWERRNGTSGPWTVIEGATAGTYQPPVLTETTQFRRKVTDAFGTSAYTAEFTITYITTPLNPGSIAITGNAMVCAGSTAGMIKSSASASNFGENVQYRWQTRGEDGEWIEIPGAIRGDYTPGAITGRTYFRRGVIDYCGTSSRTAYSNEVVFDIFPQIPLKTGIIDAPIITCTGTAPGTIISVLDACGSGAVKYQWESTTGNGIWQTITSNGTGPSYTPGVQNTTVTYRRKVTDACGNVGYSNEVTIFVYPPIEPGVIGNASQTVCVNGTASTLRLLTNCHYTDGTVTYQWESSIGNNGPWNRINGATAGEYQPSVAGTTMYYRLKVSSTTCNAVAYTNVARVMVAAGCTPQVSALTTSVCNSSNTPVNITFDNSSSCSYTSYDWEYGVSAGSTINWTGTGWNTLTLNVRPYLQSNQRVHFRMKAVNTDCNQVVYSNVVTIDQNLACQPSGGSSVVQMYPNPALTSDVVTLKTNLVGQNQVTLKTVQGTTRGVTVLSSSNGVLRLKLPADLSSGTYFVHIMNQKGVQVVEKLVISK